MDKYIVDLNHCNGYPELHERFRTALGWPEFYGKNWDAFWDCLTGYMKPPVFIQVKGFATAGEEIKDARIILEKLFRKAHEAFEGIDYQMED